MTAEFSLDERANARMVELAQDLSRLDDQMAEVSVTWFEEHNVEDRPGMVGALRRLSEMAFDLSLEMAKPRATWPAPDESVTFTSPDLVVVEGDEAAAVLEQL